jgi:Tfp pilus assembly protein PilF
MVLLSAVFGCHLQAAPVQNITATVLAFEGKVTVAKAGDDVWGTATTNQVLTVGDRLRTAQKSRATIRLSNQSTMRVNESTTLTIREVAKDKQGSWLDVITGSIYIFDREKPSAMRFNTRMVSGAVRGTEFHLEVAEDGTTKVALLDGSVHLENAQGQLTVGSGEQAVVEPGKPPVKTAMIEAVNIIQWCLYYPAILDVDELRVGAQPELTRSVEMYRQGDLLAALAAYPENRLPANDAERVYYAALLLSVGQVETANELLKTVSTHPLATALHRLIAAVKNTKSDLATEPKHTGEWMAESYYQQSRSNLEGALKSARKAVTQSPNFGFAHARLAELEFSFGRTEAAWQSVEKALQISPRNAQALALKGFLLAARGRVDEALGVFDQAIAVDGALANAWLGRGLCLIRKGKAEQGRLDLQTAAALEPQRSILRSYLGKAYAQTKDLDRARKELGLAHQLDLADPTPPLYSALLNQQDNRMNAAVRDLEESIRLNDNRSVYRSQFLLDQDRAVRSANLAAIYQDAGMKEVAQMEAIRAASYDYGNYSAHLFLANSYDAMRDPRANSLRYETAWLSEYLLANLLAPVGAGALSAQISQQEYARMFERDRLGLASSTEYYSGGDWFQGAVQYGTVKNTAYAVETYYRSEHGQSPNSDLLTLTTSAKVKQQLTPADSIYVEAAYSTVDAGDISQYYNPAGTVNGYRYREHQEPLVLAGYHHEWQPGHHSLFLFARLHDRANSYTPSIIERMIRRNAADTITGVTPVGMEQRWEDELNGYSFDYQHVFQTERHNTLLGGRYQFAELDSQSQLVASPPASLLLPVTASAYRPDFKRGDLYAYHYWNIVDPLTIVGGVSFQYLQSPNNPWYPPVADGEEIHRHIAPRAGFLWQPFKTTLVRGAFSQNMSGMSMDQSFQLEPANVAGFNNASRSIIPTSISGMIPGAKSDSFGLAAEQKLPTQTYLGVAAEYQRVHASQYLGVFQRTPVTTPDYYPATLGRELEYRERSVSAYVHQLLAEEWAINARYRLSEVNLADRLPAMPVALDPNARLQSQAILHQLELQAVYQHRCGFFGRFSSLWNAQSNQDSAAALAGDDFWQLNLFLGYRFPRRRAEIQFGILNLTAKDYRVNSLSTFQELPRDRTLFTSLKFNF